MPIASLPKPLTVAISSRALFDLEDSHGLFEREGIAAYQAFQREHEDDVLAPGIAFPLVRKLLALNAGAPAMVDGGTVPRVEVILLSRNSSDTGLRIFNSIQHHGLDIRRATFTSGAPTWPYI
jgi:5'-nucleotidase